MNRGTRDDIVGKMMATDALKSLREAFKEAEPEKPVPYMWPLSVEETEELLSKG